MRNSRWFLMAICTAAVSVLSSNAMAIPCVFDTDCDDSVGCTVDLCDTTGNCVNTPDNAPCLDADLCNGTEVCDATAGCIAGTPLDCDDSDPCTADTCVAATGCDNSPGTALVGVTCDDGDLCTVTDVCDAAGGCAGTAKACADTFGCTVDTCDAATGNCVNTPDDAFCLDADLCDGPEVCNPTAGCQNGTAPLDCDDSDPCTADTCVAATGCDNSPGTALVGVTCDDGDLCTVTDECDAAGGCAGTAKACADTFGCTVDTCDAATGNCVNTPDDTVCDDGNECDGTDFCDPATGCNNGTPVVCIDADLCNGTETCTPATGACVAGTDLVCDDGDPCTDDSCDPTAGCETSPRLGACCNFNGTCSPDVCEAACTGEAVWSEGQSCVDVGCMGIPTVSEWGLIVMTLLGCTLGTIVYGRRRAARTA